MYRARETTGQKPDPELKVNFAYRFAPWLTTAVRYSYNSGLRATTSVEEEDGPSGASSAAAWPPSASASASGTGTDTPTQDSRDPEENTPPIPPRVASPLTWRLAARHTFASGQRLATARDRMICARSSTG